MKSPCFKVWLGGGGGWNSEMALVSLWQSGICITRQDIAKKKVRQKLKFSLELQDILFNGKTRNTPLQASFLRHTLILQFLESFYKSNY